MSIGPPNPMKKKNITIASQKRVEKAQALLRSLAERANSHAQKFSTLRNPNETVFEIMRELLAADLTLRGQANRLTQPELNFAPESVAS